MAKETSLTQAGRWAFIVGVILALLTGFVEVPGVTVILLILGVLVGFLNVTEAESTSFLIAVLTLLVIGLAGAQVATVFGTLEGAVRSVYTNFTAFAGTAGLVVALKEILAAARAS